MINRIKCTKDDAANNESLYKNSQWGNEWEQLKYPVNQS